MILCNVWQVTLIVTRYSYKVLVQKVIYYSYCYGPTFAVGISTLSIMVRGI